MNELREKKYKYEKVKATGEMTFTEDGHTMFFEDVLKKLHRLEYLELIQSQPINKELEKSNKTENNTEIIVRKFKNDN